MIRFYDKLFDDELVEIEEQDIRYMMWTQEGIAIVNTGGFMYLANVVYVKENMEKEEDVMEKYFINYNTGAGNEEAETLEEAIEMAEANLAYTQQSVTIEYNGKEVARLPWWGRTPDEDDVVTEQFGSYGYYGEWDFEERDII